jgi:hypothetical protein
VKNIIAVLGLCLLFSCTQNSVDSTPAKVLENYIHISFNATSVADKKRMEDLLTGDTKTRLASWSDEQFSKAFLGSTKKFLGLKVLETKKVSDAEVALTYELSYQEGPKDQAAEITQRKMGTVVKEGDAWKIQEVRSIRESIEYLKELSLPGAGT